VIAFGCRTSSLGTSQPASICFCEDTFIRGGCKNTTALGTVVGESQRMYPPHTFLEVKAEEELNVGRSPWEGRNEEGTVHRHVYMATVVCH
jgi:hypothetical protein